MNRRHFLKMMGAVGAVAALPAAAFAIPKNGPVPAWTELQGNTLIYHAPIPDDVESVTFTTSSTRFPQLLIKDIKIHNTLTDHTFGTPEGSVCLDFRNLSSFDLPLIADMRAETIGICA